MSGLVHNDVSALVMVNYLALVGLTIGGASQPSRNNHEKWEWDTISEMITRDDRIKHGFVLFVLFSVIAIYFVIYLLLLRTKRMNELYHKQCNPMETMATYAAWISYAVASVTLLGVGVVSTDLDTPTHTTLASVSFVSLLLTSMFLATSMHGHTKYHPAWVYACVAGGAGVDGAAGVARAAVNQLPWSDDDGRLHPTLVPQVLRVMADRRREVPL